MKRNKGAEGAQGSGEAASACIYWNRRQRIKSSKMVVEISDKNQFYQLVLPISEEKKTINSKVALV